VLEVKEVVRGSLRRHLLHYGYARSKARGIRSMSSIIYAMGLTPRRLPWIVGLLYHVLVYGERLGDEDREALLNMLGLGPRHVTFIDSRSGEVAVEKTERCLRRVLRRLYGCRL